jgi:hypothetical protein
MDDLAVSNADPDRIHRHRCYGNVARYAAGIEWLGSVMVDVRISDHHKRSFMRELTTRVMHSLNVNSDIFEIYVMRNIFHIPVDVDLTGSLVRVRRKNSISLSSAVPVRTTSTTRSGRERPRSTEERSE